MRTGTLIALCACALLCAGCTCDMFESLLRQPIVLRALGWDALATAGEQYEQYHVPDPEWTIFVPPPESWPIGTPP